MTFTSVNATPLDERNSFAAWQGPQVGVEKTVTLRSVTRLTSPGVESILPQGEEAGNQRALTG